jgi:hypothetical protein
MPVLTEGKHNLEFVIYEEEADYSREVVTIAAAAPAMVPGTLVGKITASGKYTVYNDAATDGTQVAAGIVAYAVPDLAADRKAVIISRLAVVRTTDLTGADANGLADLKAIGIIAR